MVEPTLKSTSSVHDITKDKPPFGSRFLTDKDDVWSQNAWDHVPPPDDQDERIAQSLEKQRKNAVPEEEWGKYNEKPAKHWDNFYKNNSSNFFRNRKWLHNEFPELVAAAQPEAGAKTIVEIGCGAGNAVFPLLSSNLNPSLQLRAYDYSSHAVKLVQNNPLYLDPPVGFIQAAVWDLSSEELPPGVAAESVDIVVMVFVLSALHPAEWGRALANVHKMLKPGGMVMFRDYGRHDLTQLRFKSGRLLEENFYIRGDKTRVYFFELDELALLFTGSHASPEQMTVTETTEEDGEDEDSAVLTPTPQSPPPVDSSPPVSSSVQTEAQLASDSARSESVTVSPSQSSPRGTTAATTSTQHLSGVVHRNLLPGSSREIPSGLFETAQLGVDRRLIVNRKRQIKMYRVWMQGKFVKVG